MYKRQNYNILNCVLKFITYYSEKIVINVKFFKLLNTLYFLFSYNIIVNSKLQQEKRAKVVKTNYKNKNIVVYSSVAARVKLELIYFSIFNFFVKDLTNFCKFS